MSEQSEKAEPRKLAPGDRVQLKGGHGPKMVVNDASRSIGEIECMYWDDTDRRFFERTFHRDALQLVQSDSGEEFTAIGQVNGGGLIEFVSDEFERLRPRELIYVKRIELKR